VVEHDSNTIFEATCDRLAGWSVTADNRKSRDADDLQFQISRVQNSTHCHMTLKCTKKLVDPHTKYA
jgi:hypothetical protein